MVKKKTTPKEKPKTQVQTGPSKDQIIQNLQGEIIQIKLSLADLVMANQRLLGMLQQAGIDPTKQFMADPGKQ